MSDDIVETIKSISLQTPDRRDFFLYRSSRDLHKLLKKLQGLNTDGRLNFMEDSPLDCSALNINHVLPKLEHVRPRFFAHVGNGPDDRKVLHCIVVAVNFFELVGEDEKAAEWHEQLYRAAREMPQQERYQS